MGCGPRRKRFSARCAQRGQALLFTMLLAGIGIGIFAFNMVRSVSLEQEQDVKTRLALVQVRDALIGWSAARTSPIDGANARPGELPCPDINPLDGYEDGNCAAGAIGRVPWKTLRIPELKDETGETLWYAIGGPFRIWNVNTNPINSDTKGNITVYLNSTATQLTGEAVAVVFAPGAPLGTQNRDPAVSSLCPTTGTTIPRNRCAANYLETTGGVNNATANGPFVSAQRSPTFNDRLLVLTTAELMPVVEQRVARELLNILELYRTNSGCNCYPWPDLSTGFSDFGLNRGRIPGYDLAGTTSPPYALPVDWGQSGAPVLPQWFIDNGWRRIIYYAVGKNFLENSGSGCTSCETGQTYLSVDGVWNRRVVLLTPGPAGTGRPVLPYPWTNWTPYLDDAENSDNNNDRYVTPSSTARTRDRIFTIP
jgi:hypothetical protein